MSDPKNSYVQLSLTFDDGDVKELDMPLPDYHRFKEEIRMNRKPGSEATVTVEIMDANGTPGQMIIPWGKVRYAEAFLVGNLDAGAVAKQLLGSPASEQPKAS